MLSCKEVAERASALIDGDLGAWDAFKIRLHLAICRGCRQFIGQMRATRDLTRQAVEGDTDPHSDRAAEDSRIDAILSRAEAGKKPGD